MNEYHPHIAATGGSERSDRLGRRDLIRCLGFAAVQGIVVLLVVGFALKLWRYDLRVPLNYWGDTLWFSALTKGLVTHPWAFFNPELSAPYSFDAVAFPSIATFDWAFMKAMSIGLGDAGRVLNGFWLLSLVLTAWTSSAALFLLRVHPWIAFLTGIAYALLPFALLRNVTHVSLVYYTVPLLCLLAISIARGGFGDHRDRHVRTLGFLAALAQGFNYVYFSFFGLGLLLLAGAMPRVNRRKAPVLRTMGTAVAILAIASFVNLVPSLYNWSTYGKPADMEYKAVTEAEVYGLKLRRMLAPSESNPVPLLRTWGGRDAATPFPNENENRTARLGLMGSLGLVLVFGTAMFVVRFPNEESGATARSACALGLATFLVSTVGGLGAVFNLLTVPDIRAYNRFSVFLAFLALVPLAILVTGLLNAKRWRKVLVLGLFTLVACASVFDQLLDALPLVQRQAGDQAAARDEQAVVRRMEGAFPAGAAIFQLPVTQFPSDGGIGKMLPYDHARPYLWSTALRWSWPSFSQRHAAWQQALLDKVGHELVDYLVLSGFDGIWLDRYGMSNSDAAVSSLREAGAAVLFDDRASRYVVLDLREARDAHIRRLGETGFKAASEQILGGPVAEWGAGFYGAERNPAGQAVRWSRSTSGLTLRNYSDAKMDVKLSMLVYSQYPGAVSVRGAAVTGRLEAGPASPRNEFHASIPAGGSTRLSFDALVDRLVAANDPRELYFAIVDPKISMAATDRKPAKQ